LANKTVFHLSSWQLMFPKTGAGFTGDEQIYMVCINCSRISRQGISTVKLSAIN